MSKKWLTFDLDGTLMQNPFVGWIFPEIVHTIQEHLEEKKDIMQLILDEHLKRMNNNQVLEAYDWDNIVEGILLNLNLPISINIEELVLKHSVAPKVYALEENIIENLKQLEVKGYSLAVVTNGYLKYQFPVLKELGLSNSFKEIITPEQCGYAKPNVKILDSFIGKGNIYGHVGDRIDHDIVMANKLGIKSIFINRKLPTLIRNLPIEERKNDETFIQLCKEKWLKENNGERIPFTDDCIPDIVINSMEELADYL